MKREEKAQYVENLRDSLATAQVIVKTRFQGLDVEGINELRRNLRTVGASYRVVKNTLLRRVVNDTDMAPLADGLKGPMALAFSNSAAVETAKALTAFAKTHKPLVIEGGLLSGKELSANDIDTLAKLPSLEQLRGQLLGLFQAVPQKMVRLLQAPSRDMVGVLEARRRNLEEQG